MYNNIRIGVDLGGTKTEIVALDIHGDIILRHRVISPRNNYQLTIQTISQLVIDAEAQLKCKATIGVATPGAISSASGAMKNSNSTWLNGQTLQHDLQQVLERPVRMANDANCFALSEASDGAGKDANCVFGVILGTGVGGGVVVNGQVLQGANAISGEWGHNPLPWPAQNELPGPACYCGRSGCIETFLSGPGLQADYRDAGKHDLNGQHITAQQVLQYSECGDEFAIQVLNRYQSRLAKALASVINVLDPDVIVLGGGLSNIAHLYDVVPGLWGEYVFSDSVATRLLPPKHGDSSGVRGAAWLWPIGECS